MRLTVEEIGFGYNGRPVLKGVSFDLEPGQVLGVLGVNGAGKSTLLKCLNRILTPRHGVVRVDGEALRTLDRNTVAQRIAYVPQRHTAGRLTVFEAVLLGRKPHIHWTLSAQDYDLVEKVIRQIGLQHLAMRPVGDLSGGEMQKVAIALALAQSPGILLLDEPTSSLDLRNQLDVMALVHRVVKTRQLSAVVAIHDLNMAVRFADRFLFLKDHGVFAVADKRDLSARVIEAVYGVRVTLERIGGHTVVVPLE